MEVAAGDGKLIKLSLIYPSPRGRPTHTVFLAPLSSFSPYAAAHPPVHLSALRSHHRHRPLPSSSFPLSLSLFCYLAVALFPLLFVSLRFRAPRMRDLKQLKRSAKHFNLASGAPMPSTRTLIYIYLSLAPSFSVSSDLVCPLCVPRPIRSMPGRRRASRVGDARTVLTASEREKERDNGGEGWFGREAKSRIEAGERARGGPTSMERTRKSERKTEKSQEHQEETGGGWQGGSGGGDGLTPVCLRGANGVLQLF